MPNRDLNVNIDGDPKGIVKALAEAERRLKRFEKELERAERQRDTAMARLANATKKTQQPVTETTSLFTRMFGLIGKMGPAKVSLVAGSIQALPAVAGLAAAGVVAAFGTGLAGLGLVAAAQSDRVRHEWSDLASDLREDLGDTAEPFEDTLIRAAHKARQVWRSLRPELREAFEEMQPGVDRFLDSLGDGIAGMDDLLVPMGRSFSRLLGAFSDRMPQIMDQLEDSLETFIDMMNSNPTMLPEMVQDAATLLNFLTKVLEKAQQINSLGGGIQLPTPQDLDAEMKKTLSPEEWEQYLRVTGRTADSVRDTAAAHDELGSAADGAKAEVRDLSAALEDFFSPAHKALSAEIRLKEAIQDATEAAKDQKLTGLERLKAIRDLTGAIAESAQAEVERTGKTKESSRAFVNNMDKLIAWAGKNRNARQTIDQLARSLGITITRTRQGTIAVDRFGRAVRVLPNGKTVRINANTAAGRRQLSAFLLHIARQRGTVSVFVRTIYDSPSGRAALLRKNTETGAIDRYAAGDIRRSTAPVIASTPTILFGEGMDDEAFIPYERRYRQRAIGILNQVASDFGLARQAVAVGGGTVTVRLVADGADAEMLRLMRKLVRVEGRGNVQLTFGK